MTREEAKTHIEAAKMMLLNEANEPVSDLYYALDIAAASIDNLDHMGKEIKDIIRTPLMDIELKIWKVVDKYLSEEREEEEDGRISSDYIE